MDQIDQVRQKIDIVDLISEYIPLKKAGRNFKAVCPFHEEKTPSFMVSPERQIFKCFGCQIGGDVFKFLMETEKIEFGEALRMLADKAGIELKQYRPSRDQEIKEKLMEINHMASEFYHYLLTSHSAGKKGLQYLLKRGITKASIKTFKLGFAADEWESLQGYLVKKKGYKSDLLEKAGLIIKSPQRPNSYYDRFRGRIVFPLFDHRGRVVGFSGRVLDKDVKEAKYVNSPETILYHKSNVLYGLETTKDYIKKSNKAVVVEGELDAISSYQAGIKNVVAIKGSALTEGQVSLLKRFCENLALALDADTAGDRAARRGIEIAEAASLNVRVIVVKYGKDPDDCAQKSARLWKDSVKEAIPIYDFYINSVVSRFGVDTPEGKRKVSEEMAVILAGVTNEVIKAHYIKKLSEVLQVDEEAVIREVARRGRMTEAGMSSKPIEKNPVTVVNLQIDTEQYLLALLLQVGADGPRLVKKIDEKLLTEGAVKKVIIRLKKWGESNKKWDINRFVKSLPAELVEVVDTAYLTELGKLTDDIDRLELELIKTISNLKRMSLKDKMERISAAIKQAEKRKEKNKVIKLQQKFVETSKQLKG